MKPINTEDMNIYEQKQNMEEAFGVYLKECCGIDEYSKLYYEIIDECLKDVDEDKSPNEEKSFFDIINELIESGKYNDLTKEIKEEEKDTEDALKENEGESISFIEVLEKFRDFLIAYKFFKEWNKPTVMEDEEDGTAQNMIVFGAPGTGKSTDINQRIKRTGAKEFRITFHPDTDYAAFVGCYKPVKENGELTYKFVPQAFTNAYVEAWTHPNKSVFLVVEEINRGNCAQIFGDIFQLLDRNEKDNENEKKGESKFHIIPDTDLKNYLFEEAFSDAPDSIPEDIRKGEKLRLPSNLSIFATMNTSDQSLYPMDSAFKRRWEWKYIPITYGRQEKYIVTDVKNMRGYAWSEFLEAVNKCIIEITKSEDKQLGYWFVGESNYISVKSFVNKVVFYLWNDIFKDYQDEGNSPFKKCGGLSFQSFYDKNTINLGNVDSFLRNGLGLVIKDDVLRRIEISNQVSDNQKISVTSGKLRVTFPDGKIIDDKKGAKVLEKVIEKIGIEKVRSLKIMVSGCPLIADSLEDVKVSYRQSMKNHVLSNGMYLFTTTSTPVKAEQLKRIATQLGIDYTVEILGQNGEEDEDTD